MKSFRGGRMLDLLCWVINWPIMRRLLRSRRLDPDSVFYSPSIAHSKRWEKFSGGFYEGYLNTFAIELDSAGVVSRPMIKSGGNVSKYWGYICKDCNKETDHWFNHGQAKLIEYYHAYRLLNDRYHWDWIDLEVLGGDFADRAQMQKFLDLHKGHAIYLQNEYGELQAIPTIDQLAGGKNDKR